MQPVAGEKGLALVALLFQAFPPPFSVRGSSGCRVEARDPVTLTTTLVRVFMAVVVSVLPCADSVLVYVVLCGVHLPPFPSALKCWASLWAGSAALRKS